MARVLRSSHEKPFMKNPSRLSFPILGARETGGGAWLGIYLFESQVFYFKEANEEPFIYYITATENYDSRAS